MKLIHKIIALALLPLIIGGTIILSVDYSVNKHTLTVEAEEHTLLQAKMSDQTIQDFFAKHINILVALATSQVLKTERLDDILSQLKLILLRNYGHSVKPLLKTMGGGNYECSKSQEI